MIAFINQHASRFVQKVEFAESSFAILDDNIIVHIASALPLDDACNFKGACKHLHTLATTRIDMWWNWAGAMAALEEEVGPAAVVVH